jgi:hypothetical protein
MFGREWRKEQRMHVEDTALTHWVESSVGGGMENKDLDTL